MSHQAYGRDRRRTLGRRLTDRQAAILDLVASGLGNKAIAHRLGISEQAAKEHVSTLLRRLDVRNRAMLGEIAATLRIAGADLPATWLEVLFRRAPLYMAFIGRDRRFVAANDAVLRIAGADPIGRDYREVFSSVAASVAFEKVESVFATGKPRELHELAVVWDRSGDGKPEPGHATAFIEPIRDEHGDVEAVAVFAFDVSDVVSARATGAS